jgi:type IV pilus assembly protein PilA
MAGYPSPQQPPQQPPYRPAPDVPGPAKRGFPKWAMVLLGCGGIMFLVGGPLAVMAIYGVRRYIAAAKSAEAINSLHQIDTLAVAAFEHGSSTPHGQAAKAMCASASASVPATIASVAGKKYQSTSAEWRVDAARNAGFACLKFELGAPQYYLYKYAAQGSSSPGDVWSAEADGDLAGDGTIQTFRTAGRINSAHALEVTQIAMLTAP